MHVNVLKAEVKTLVSAVEVLREKHNLLTEDLRGAFTTIDDWGRTQERRWDICEQELHDIKNQLGRHGQDFIDCGTFLNAQRVAADEKFQMYEATLASMTLLMNEKAAFLQDRFVPESMATFQAKMDRELEAMKSRWMPTALSEITRTLEGSMKDLIDGRVEQETRVTNDKLNSIGNVSESAFHHLEQRILAFDEHLKIIGTVSESTFMAMEKQLVEVAARGVCPCMSGQCPCPCRRSKAMGSDGAPDPLQSAGCDPWYHGSPGAPSPGPCGA